MSEEMFRLIVENVLCWGYGGRRGRFTQGSNRSGLAPTTF
jgi:hypothetical protein